VGLCENLAVRDVIRGFDAVLSGELGHTPRLAATSADGAQVTLVVREQADPIPLDVAPALAQVTLHPWDSWPDSPLGTALFAASVQEFVVPKRPDDGLTVWLFASTFATGPQMVLLNGASTDVPWPSEALVHPSLVGAPSFVTTELSGTRTVGTVIGSGINYATINLATAAGFEGMPPDIGCAAGPMAMDGVRVAARFVTAYTHAPGCTAPNTLSLVTVVEAGNILEETYTQPLDTSLAQVQLVPRGDGAWLIWQLEDGETSGPLETLKLDDEGKPIGEPIVLIGSGTIFEKVALSVFGDGLAVAYTDSFDPGPPSIVVAVFDGDGSPLAQASLTPQAWPRVAEGYGLIGSPAGDALLLSWASDDVDASVQGNARVYTARLDCSR
jgi:hypothetical protein